MEYEFFSKETDPALFFCQETNESTDSIEFKSFVFALDRLRRACGFPLVITSGYRSPSHSIEAKKDKPGQHTIAAADISCRDSAQRHRILKYALDLGFTGIGIDKHFIHVDKRKTTPMCWVY